MTVCVAAIAEKTILIGASDRMLTAGNVEFEPDQSKIWCFSKSIVALIAGDAGVQAEILKEVHKQVTKWINDDPATWVRVRDVASLYCKEYRSILREQAEAEILHPLGLDIPTFLAKQSTMHPDVIADIAARLSSFELIGTSGEPLFLETIFMGTDTDGPLGEQGQKLNYAQLYVTTGDKMSWMTTVGFAAIGIGRSHAESQFMFSGHSPAKPFPETILLTYAAKKRAEVAPGVGKFTDMVVIGPAIGTLMKVEEEHLKGLDLIYQRTRRANDKAVKKAQLEARDHVKKVQQEYTERAEKDKLLEEGK